MTDEARSRTNESTLAVFATSLSGIALQVSAPPDEKRGLVVGARVGLHATRPSFSGNGGQLGIMPTLSIRHDFGSTRTDWTGAVALSMELWKLRILSGIGYGLTSKPDLVPAPLFEINVAVGMKFGPVWTGVQFDTLWRLSDGSRSLHITAQVGFEWELQREIFR